MTGRILSAFALLSMLIGAPGASAGEIGPGLKAQLDSTRSNEPIKVWIKLPDNMPARTLKTVATAASRAERHRIGMETLRSEHANAQRNLLNRLDELHQHGRVSVVRPYWIVNVVEASIMPNEIAAIASRSDVESVQLLPQIYSVSDRNDDVTPAPTEYNSAEANLVYINARQAWAAGYTGAGRLVCSFDTGVEGGHVALKNNWKGLDGDSTAAWFDPVFGQKFPHTQINSPNHGTHVMGIMVGHNDATGDTIGVAPGAKWMSACAIDVNQYGASVLLRAFEWVADPDGNPNTVDDLPDVINNSWGFNRVNFNVWNIYCENIFFDAIDNVEALGIVCVFAAGNSGPDVGSIANPANRALTSIDCFAVGNLNYTTETLGQYSSQGPSDCNGATKPNVMAPGVSIRSSVSGTSSYGYMSGTSMATPHVSGLVALLRQKNPNATVDEIKNAILSSVVTNPNYGTVPNNSFGWGRIDCMAALNALSAPSSSPGARVYDFNAPAGSPGDTIEGTVYVQCLGANLNSVTATVTSANPSVQILQGNLTFGNLTTGQIAPSSELVRAVISDTVTPGQILAVDVQISGTGYSLASNLYFIINPPVGQAVATHNTGRIQFSISNFGSYGLGPGSMYPGGGVGFKWNDRVSDLYEGGLMIGRSFSEVSDGLHRYIMEAERDFIPAADGAMEFVSPGPASYEQTHCIFDDRGADQPMGIRVEQNSYADNGTNDDFVILQYIITNMSDAPLTGMYAGLYMDWDPNDVYTQSVGGFETLEQLLWMAYYNGGNPIQYRGLKVLQGTLATALTERSALLSRIPADGGDGFETFEKYQALTAGLGSADTYRTSYSDLFSVIAAGPFDLAVGASDTVAIAVLAGTTFDEIKNAANRAVDVPTDVGDSEPSSVPSQFLLHQNYPNPFNPSTVIKLEFPQRTDYTLTIYNVVGQVVWTREGHADAGIHEIEWNASGLASGVYFYEVSANGQKQQRKALLLK